MGTIFDHVCLFSAYLCVFSSDLSIVDISANLKNIDIDSDLEILENIDIDKEILENIDIDKEILTRAECYRKVREYQCISSISASAGSADQQHQHISASAASVHQRISASVHHESDEPLIHPPSS